MIISKDEALKLNQKWFFTGIICKNNHIDKRYVSTGICYKCKSEQVKRDYLNHKSRITACTNKSNLKHKDRVLATNKNWINNNLEKSREIKRNFKLRNREKYLEQSRNYAKKKRANPNYRINSAISKQIWSFLKHKKGGRKWETLVNYSYNDLKKHLESLFKSDMSWENYGKIWEIDHIVPKSWFKDSEEVSVIWNLNNLKPEYCSVNRSKGNRYVG